MKKRILLWLLLVALASVGIFAVDTALTCRALSEKTVRLHVVANSDSEADQAQKLRVRDAVLACVSEWTAGCRTAEEAKQAISAHLPEIEASARAVLAAEGSGYAVSVSLGREHFGTRRYDTFTLPAGVYPALRVKLGQARGHNWWCVVFPSLCTAATSDAVEACASLGGSDSAEAELVTGGEARYTLRFKTFEWLETIAGWFS